MGDAHLDVVDDVREQAEEDCHDDNGKNGDRPFDRKADDVHGQPSLLPAAGAMS